MLPWGRVMATIQIYGRLGKAPEERTSKTGKPMVTASMVTDLGRDNEMFEWFGLIGFGAIGEVLARHAKGDMVAVGGRLSKSAWKGRDGTERTGFSVCVDAIASARTVRPRKPKARDAEGAVPFDDALRF
jgi:single-strand DNA-binding protein